MCLYTRCMSDTCVSTCMWRPEASVWNHPPLLFYLTLMFSLCSLLWPVYSYQACSRGPSSTSLFLPMNFRGPELQAGCTPTTIFMGSGDLNSVPSLAWNVLLTIEPSLQPLRLYCYENRCKFKIGKEPHHNLL